MTGESRSPALTLSEVSAGYGDAPVLHGITVTVRAGGWLAVVGPNGAGKSTLLKSMAGLAHATGEILLFGQTLGSLPRKRLARTIGYAPQQPAIPEGLTVTDYVLLGRTPHLGPLARDGSTDHAVVADALTRMDLTAFAARRLHTLSGGERQRAVLARVLAQRASVLLLDEPTTGLDLGHAQALLEQVDQLRATHGLTVVSTVHDLTSAAQYAEDLLLLSGGEAVANGRPAEVLTTRRIEHHYAATVDVLHRDGGIVVAPRRDRG
ncbi:ABC transporter ATP-binding protein [Haloechinothrix sp. LS1_15]|uniref:ABC transporter ATP-binding protein n=1 Tax=Haloechinothrix sp. LS1_15 TaxID=2652248 RepID=UPI0029467F13|nr:ABC transporter ATP-binding protein [Haloechinothrix sp. LS1_15]MDV6012673.1 ABC transporter ATP-binding protein [Haloechinothrix sp. LS1_15]